VIDFVQAATDGGPIKIGTTDNLDTRLRVLEADYGRPLAVLATRPGGRAEERQWHRRFAHLRLGRTEQFRPAAELLEAIGRPLLVGPNPEAAEVMDNELKPVRITEEALDLARIASSYTGETMSDYVSRIVAERSREDIDKGHEALKS
jgi:hypothetical protein